MLAAIIVGAIVLIIYVMASNQPAPATIDKLTVSPDLIAKSATITTPPASNQIAQDWLASSVLAAKEKIEGAKLIKNKSNLVTILQNLPNLAQAAGLVHPETILAKVVGVGMPEVTSNKAATGFLSTAFQALKEKQTTLDTYKTPEPLKQIIINTPTIEPPKSGSVIVNKALKNLQPSTINPKLKLTAQV